MKTIKHSISDSWLKASVAGSIWAANEIILGSFLHNLRIPLSGTFMAFLSVAVVVSFSMIWKDKYLIIKAGLIAALMKSISPSAIIIGPMVGIILEAGFLQLFVILLGRNLTAFAVGGAFAVSGVLFQKIGRLLISYGTGFLEILDNLFKYAVKQLHLTTQNPWKAVLILISFYAFWGITAAFTGYFAGKKASRRINNSKIDFSPDYIDNNTPGLSAGHDYSIVFLLMHLVALITGMYLINTVNHWISTVYVASYIVFVIWKYRNSVRRLQKPTFWIWFAGITLLAALFLNNNETPGLSWQGLTAGLLMNLRAALVLFSFAAISTELKNPIIKSLMYRHGAAALYQSLELSFGILPAVTALFPSHKKLIKKPLTSIVDIIGNADSILRFVKKQSEQNIKLLIVTGKIQEGKTSFLKKLTSQIKNKKITGFYSEVDIENGERKGYFLREINSGEKILLCSTTPSEKAVHYGPFWFNQKAFDTGKQIITKALKDNADIIIIDEAGPLEIKGKGWAAAIDKAIKHNNITLIITIRESLVEEALKQWGRGMVAVLNASETNALQKATDFVLS